MMADVADQLYAQQQVIVTQLADLRADVKGLTADVAAQLGHGQRRMEDHEMRLRIVERALPDDAEPRLAALEASAQRRRGAVSVVTLIISLVVGIGGSSTAAALITYFMTRHH